MQGPGRDDAAGPHPRLSRTPECARACSCRFSGNLSAGQGRAPWGGAPRRDSWAPSERGTLHSVKEARTRRGVTLGSDSPRSSEPRFTRPWNGHNSCPYRPGRWAVFRKAFRAAKRSVGPRDRTPSARSAPRSPRGSCGPRCFNSEIPALVRGVSATRARYPLDPEMPEPSFRRGRREVSGKAAPPLCPPEPGHYKSSRALQEPSRRLTPPRTLRPPLAAMAPGAARPALPALLALIGALIPGLGGAQISVHPPEAIIPRGGSVQVNCSASCNQTLILGLETQLVKKEVAQGDHWKVFELSDVQEDSHPLCFANCHKQMIAPMSVTVYWFPERVEMLPLPRWQPVGENLTLRCQVTGGAPRENLTVVLLRGEEELSRQPAVGEPAEVTVPVLVGKDHHLANFSCRTELDLRPRGLGLFQNSSAPRQLRTFVLLKNHLHLATPPIVEVGTQWTVNCTLDELFPAAEAEVRLTLAEQELNSTSLYSKDSVLATANVKANATEKGTHQLACVVTLGGRDLKTEKDVILYSFPAPNLILSEPEVSEGTVVTVQCEAQAGAIVLLRELPSGPPTHRAEFQLNASAADHRRSFSCSAVLDVAGHLVHKNQTRELHVLYGPRLDQRDCPGNWTWEEGSQQTLRCQAWGNPVPELKCNRKGDNALLPIGDLRPVKREVAGTYLCKAWSSRGEVSREVVVNVTYHQNNMVVIILVTAALLLGTVSGAAYLYNRQRKIQKYKLQKAQEAAAMKLNTPATPP